MRRQTLKHQGLPMPVGTERLFSEDCLAPRSREERSPRSIEEKLSRDSFVLGRLLEDGDSKDLQWLCQEFGEARLAHWVETRGSRQLSRRSLQFWQLILGVEVNQGPDVLGTLWLL